MTNKEAWIMITKKNCEVGIKNYESGLKRVKLSANRRQRFADIFSRMKYEKWKVILELINRDEEAYWKAYCDNIIYNRENICSSIRVISCANASYGRTYKVTELTENELENARKIANSLVNDYIKDLKEKVMSY